MNVSTLLIFKKTYKKIKSEKFVFRLENSIKLLLTKFIHQLSENYNNYIQTTFVFFDMEKAFELVWHEGLLFKLTTIDTTIIIVKIIKFFFTDQTFQTKIENGF